ncbi:DUF3626 domain-containing protein [Streptomyces chartreusis]|uniref:DUF3626 domain-containing protein n=1 Tax=Streptomyces chartreusis TaxID=1969 RepID=UPI00363DD7F5
MSPPPPRGLPSARRHASPTGAGPAILRAPAEDGTCHSQFVTGTSNGGLTAHPGGDRRRWESRIFGAAYDEASAPERLTAPGHPRRKRFVRLALPEGVTYRTADHLAVLPANAPELVERFAATLGADLDTVLDIRAAPPRRAPAPRARAATASRSTGP